MLINESECRSVVSDSLWPHGLYNPWNFPGQNTGVGSLSLLQRIFSAQELNRGLLHCRQILYQLSYQRMEDTKNRKTILAHIFNLKIKKVGSFKTLLFPAKILWIKVQYVATWKSCVLFWRGVRLKKLFPPGSVGCACQRRCAPTDPGRLTATRHSALWVTCFCFVAASLRVKLSFAGLPSRLSWHMTLFHITGLPYDRFVCYLVVVFFILVVCFHCFVFRFFWGMVRR